MFIKNLNDKLNMKLRRCNEYIDRNYALRVWSFKSWYIGDVSLIGVN